VPVHRTVERVAGEYHEKWSKKLAEMNDDPEAFRHRLLYPSPGELTMFSLGDELFEADILHRHALKDSMVNHAVAQAGRGPVCVLGAGFGETTLRLVTVRPTYGGELTEAGLACCRRLGLDVRQFDYYRPGDYDVIRPGSTVLSIHSLEQIPDSTHFLDGLRSVRDRVECVVHLEPTWLRARTGLIGLLRNRYMEINDYNRNLYEVLSTAPDVEILEFVPDAFGQMPLNSASLLIWRFR
jgi:hypothetical protein